jgi:hypothetical protein
MWSRKGILENGETFTLVPRNAQGFYVFLKTDQKLWNQFAAQGGKIYKKKRSLFQVVP